MVFSPPLIEFLIVNVFLLRFAVALACNLNSISHLSHFWSDYNSNDNTVYHKSKSFCAFWSQLFCLRGKYGWIVCLCSFPISALPDLAIGYFGRLFNKYRKKRSMLVIIVEEKANGKSEVLGLDVCAIIQIIIHCMQQQTCAVGIQ